MAENNYGEKGRSANISLENAGEPGSSALQRWHCSVLGRLLQSPLFFYQQLPNSLLATMSPQYVFNSVIW